ncbi:putative polysaccharide synthesis protein [Cedratvirus kamchatka]|uniref:Polysaccharide synthesis protein n=1 Tax=Cedratvirus kamchatka TaxID=2716914 RepID=A0A6G8MXC1_9VIRU|nr:putative polysaccharide synthesis protein [Cedratvirus kamchatka]
MEEGKMRTLVIYSFQELNSNLAFFRKHAGKDPEGDFATLFCQPQELELKLSEVNPDDYDYYIFLSSALCGPFLPLWYTGNKTWIDVLTCSLSGDTLLQTCDSTNETAFATNRKGFLLGLVPFCLDNVQKLSEKIIEKGFAVTNLCDREKPHPYESIFVKDVNPMYPLWHDRGVRKEAPIGEDRKILVCYTFHEYNDNVKYFIKHGYFEHDSIDFYFVVNGKIDNLPQLPGKVIQRDNKGYDFAAWARAIYDDCNFEKYEEFVFVNSSVRGPFLPSYCELNWVHVYCSHLSPEIGLVGSSVTASKEIKGRYFIQSYAYAMNKRALYFLLQKGFYNKNFAAMNKVQLIINCEEQMSYILQSRGMGIKPLHSSHHDRDFLVSPFAESYDLCFNPAHLRDNYYGMHIHPFEFIFLKYNTNNQHQNQEVEYYTKLYL